MGLEAFLSRRRLNLARLCEALTPTVPLKQGVSGIYTLYFMDVCAMISSPHPRRVPVELPNGTVEYIFLQPYLSALYMHFKRELKHEPIWFCEGLPFHERPLFATKIKELCSLHPILLSTTSAELDIQASFISVQWLVIRSSIDTHMLDFILTSQGSCVCGCNVDDVSHPVPTIRPSARDTEVVTYTMQKLPVEQSTSTEATFTADPGSSITTHANQVVAYQSSLAEIYENTASDYNHSTLRQNKAYYDPIDVIDEAIARGKQIDCCSHCGLPVLPESVSSRRGMTSFLTSFNFRYAPPGASLAQGSTIDSFLLNKLVDSPVSSAKSVQKGTNSYIFNMNTFDDIFSANVLINSLQAMLPPPLTLLLDTRAELAEFDASAIVPENSTVVTINKLQQKSYLSRRSRLMTNHRKSNSGVFVSYHIKKGSTLVSLNNSTSQHVHQGTESFINLSLEEDRAQSPCNFSYSDTCPIKLMPIDAKLDHSGGSNTDFHGVPSHPKNILKQGIFNGHAPESGTTDKDPDVFSKSARLAGANPFAHTWLESNENNPTIIPKQHKIPLEINSSEPATKPALSSGSIPAKSGVAISRSTSGDHGEDEIKRASSGIRIATNPNTDSKLAQKKAISIVVKAPKNALKSDNLSTKNNLENSIIHNEPHFTNDKPQETPTVAPPVTKGPPKIRKKIDLNSYIPITTKQNAKPDSTDLPKVDTSPIRPLSPAPNEDLSQDSIIHDSNYMDPIGGDSCSMSGVEVSDEAPSNLNSTNNKGPKNQAHGQDCQELTKIPSANAAALLSTAAADTSTDPYIASNASLNILTALRAYHIVTTKKRVIKSKSKSKVRNIGPTILEPALASQLYKASHYTHMIFRWCLLNEDFLHYIGSSQQQQRRITTLNTICENHKQTRYLLGFHGITMYLMCMLIRDILDCTPLPDKPSRSKFFYHKLKSTTTTTKDENIEIDTEANTSDLVTPDASSSLNSTDAGLATFVISGFKTLMASIRKRPNISMDRLSEENITGSTNTEASSATLDKHTVSPSSKKTPQKNKKKAHAPAPIKQSSPPSYYTFYDMRRIVPQMCRYLYKSEGMSAPDPYTVLNTLCPSVLKDLSTQQRNYLSHNFQRKSAISLQHTPISFFNDPELDAQQDVDVCIDTWLGSNQLRKPRDSKTSYINREVKFAPIIYDSNYDINDNIPVLAVYHSFNSVFWSSVVRSGCLNDNILPKNQLFQTIVTTDMSHKHACTVTTDSLGTKLTSLTQDLESTDDNTTLGSRSTSLQLDIWKDSQVSDRAFRDSSDNHITSTIQSSSIFKRLTSFKTTDDGNLAARQQPQSELRDILMTGQVGTGHSTPAIDSTDSSAYISASSVPNSLFLSSPSLVDLPLYKFLVPDEAASLDLSYKAFGAGLLNEKLILNTYLYTNKFFIPQPNRLAMFNILSVSGGLFMSRDERLSMEAVIRETLACLHLTYYDLDYYYYT